MDVVADLRCQTPPARVHEVVADLGTYPSWLEIVAAAQPDPAPGAGPAQPSETDTSGSPAWIVDLRAQLGPLRRTKRLRMVRTLDTVERVRFERRELDGRRHSPWEMTAEIAPEGTGAVLTMRLHYGGSLWIPALDRLLGQEIERSRPRLARLLVADPG